MSLTLYTNPMSRGRVARWMLEETGQPYDAVVLDFDGAMKSPDYLALNPMGKVPTLVHDGRVVTENAAICCYLADTFPGTGLAPRPDERADYYRWMFFAAGPLEQATTSGAMGWKVPPDRERMLGFGNFDRTIDALDGWLQTHPFICGDRFTAADVFVGAGVVYGTGFGTIPKRPAFMDYAERLTARPAHRAASAKDDGLAEASA